MSQQMTLEQAVHMLTGQLNYLMVEAHEKLQADFNIQLRRDGATGLYLIAVEVVKDGNT